MVSNDPNQCSAVVNYTATASDNCDSALRVRIYSGFTGSGGGAPYSVLVGTLAASSISFATDYGYNWHPFGLFEFGADITGTLAVASAGTYSFTLNSDDGSLLFIDGSLIVDNGNPHAPDTASGSATLTAGTHTFEVQFFECCGGPSGVDLTLPSGVTYGPGSPTIACVPPSGSTFPPGTTTVNCTAEDASGNTAPCSFTVTVNDTQPPVIACPAAITVPNDAGQCSAVVNYIATATDNCSSSVLVRIYSGHGTVGGGAPYSGLVGSLVTSGISFGTDTGFNWHPFGLGDFGADITGTLVVAAAGTYTFTLNSDDGSLLFIDGSLVVDDGGAHPPFANSGSVALTAGNHTFEVQFYEDFGGESGVDLILPAGVTYGTPVVCSPPSGSTFAVGTTPVNCTATDAAGNVAPCSFTVTVKDAEPPVIGAVTATEGGDVKNCAAIVVQGTVTITVTAADQCPLAPPSVVLVNGANTESATFVSQSANTYTYTWDVTPATAGGLWTATVTATDLGGNAVMDSFTLCVNPCQITGLVQLESFIGTGTIPLASHRVVTFKATDGLGVVLKTWTLDLTFTVGTAASGGVANYTLMDVPAGTVNLSAKTDWNKRRRLAVALDPNCQGVANFTGAAAQLKGGDIFFVNPPNPTLPPDNVVNLADYSTLVLYWLADVSVTPAAAVADMNGDGFINIFDYAILGANWFTVGDPE
jgi:hypothetical protein